MIRRSRVSPAVIVAFVLCLTAVLLPATGSANDINDKAGTTAFSFLKLGVGASTVAMGGAGSAIAPDASVMYYNPAGTHYLIGKQFVLGYHNYLLDVQSGFVGYAFPVLEDKHLGFFINYMNYGDFTETDDNGNITGSFSGGDLLLGINFSLPVHPNVTIGANAKFMHEYAHDFTSQALAGDLGVMVRLNDQVTTFGLSAYNLGGVLSGFMDHKDNLPMGLRAGISHVPREIPIVVAIDGVLPNDNDPYVNVGVELIKAKPLYVRAGYSFFGENYKTGTSNNEAFGGFAFGFGVDYNNYQISYAFMPYLDLGSSHRVTLTGRL